jgi:hypothetical protein
LSKSKVKATDVKKERDRDFFRLRIILSSVVLVFIGLALFTAFPSESPEYTEVEASQTSPAIWKPSESPAKRDLLHQVGGALIGVGLVSVVFDLINRNAQARALVELTEQATDNLADRIAEYTAQSVLGDARFVKDALTDKNRQDHLTSIVLANLDDPHGESLARRVASQLSGVDKLSNFRIQYEANSPSAARLRQTLTKSIAPGKTFRFHFQIFSEEDDAKSSPEQSDVYAWRYWLAPSESEDQVWEHFKVESIDINGVAMDVSAGPETEHLADGKVNKKSKRFGFSFEFAPAPKYTVEIVLGLPPPKEGGYVYFEPRKLTHGVDISCDLSQSDLQVILVETLRTDNVEIYELPKLNPKVKGARTDDWVMPNATVGFAFYTPVLITDDDVPPDPPVPAQPGSVDPGVV